MALNGRERSTTSTTYTTNAARYTTTHGDAEHWKLCAAYRPQEAIEVLEAAGTLEAVMFTPNGPAGVFALYAPTGASLGRIFLNEFICVRPPLLRSMLLTFAALADR